MIHCQPRSTKLLVSFSICFCVGLLTLNNLVPTTTVGAAAAATTTSETTTTNVIPSASSSADSSSSTYDEERSSCAQSEGSSMDGHCRSADPSQSQQHKPNHNGTQDDDGEGTKQQERPQHTGYVGSKNEYGYLEPWVEVHGKFFAPEDCQKIIQLAEEYGFPDTADSIDYGDERGHVSWAIDVFVQGELEAPIIANAYQQYVPKLFDLVREKKWIMDGDDTEPSLDWVFLRKYQAGEDRYMLRMHSDTNLFTVNIALNDDFDGGGIFYQQNKEEFYYDDNPVPEPPEEILGYEFAETLAERKNRTDQGIMFPHLTQGDLLIHNYTLFHGVAPIQRGTRYSLVFFFDEKHRHVQHGLPEEQLVEINNLFEMPVDLYWIDKESPQFESVFIERYLPGETETHYVSAMRTDKFLIKDPRTDQVVSEFYVYKPANVGDIMLVNIGPPNVLKERNLEDLEWYANGEELEEEEELQEGNRQEYNGEGGGEEDPIERKENGDDGDPDGRGHDEGEL